MGGQAHLERDLSAADIDLPTDDFWRRATDPADVSSDAKLPSNAAGVDYQEAIHHQGKIMVGAGQRFGGGGADESWRVPVALIDANRWNQLRVGPDRRNAEDGLYVTQNIGQGVTSLVAQDTTFGTAAGAAKHFLGHLNQSAGFAFGWQTIKQVGTTSHGFVTALSANNGQFGRHWSGLHSSGNLAYSNDVIPNATVPNGGGWSHRYWQNGNIQRIDLTRRITGIGAGNGWDWLLQMRSANGTLRNALRVHPSAENPLDFTLDLNVNNTGHDNILSLYGNPAVSGAFTLGIRGSTLAYFNGGVNRWHRFYGSQAKADSESIVAFLEDAAGRSRIRFELGLPTGTTQPAGLASGDVWAETGTGILHVVP